MTRKLTTEEFIVRAKKAHGNRYDYSKSEYKNIDTKVTIICFKHKEFKQTPYNHIQRSQNCPKCSIEQRTLKQSIGLKGFISRARNIHGNRYDYSKAIYVNNRKKVIIICDKHGEFSQEPRHHMSGVGCSKCGVEKVHDEQRLTREEFISRAKEVHSDKFDYSNVKYIDYHSAVQIICPKHQEFKQTPGDHIGSKHGCPKCGYKEGSDKLRMSNENFIGSARKVHGNKYDYSKVRYKSTHEKVIFICKDHGEFKQTPANHLQGLICWECGMDQRAESQSMSNEEFIKKATKVHGGKFNYSKSIYKRTGDKLIIICPEHREFEQRAGQHLFGQGCPECRLEVMALGTTINELIRDGKNIEGFLYVLEVFDEEEHFYKIGITSKRSVKRRYSSKKSMPYDYEILLAAPIGVIKAFQIEQGVLKELSKYIYEPQIYFGGITECLSVNPIEHDTQLAEIAGQYSSLESN